MIEQKSFLSKFKETRPLSDGSWQAKCPSHDDKQASLHITFSNDKILLRCHAGCKTEDVLKQLDMNLSDLFQEQQTKQIFHYVYMDKDGNPLYRIVKSSGKKFSIQHFDTVAESWNPGLGGRKRCLYRLPDLLDPDLQDQAILWVEGEKDADRLEKLGLLSTTTSNGAASKLEGIDISALRGREVIILPDNDEPGREYAQRVKQALIGTAERISIIELPDLEEKEDVSDWLDKGHKIAELWDLKAKSSYGSIVHVSEVIEQIREDIEIRRSGRELLYGVPTGLKSLDEKLSAGGLPCGKITILAGATSSGKSALANTCILSAVHREKKVLLVSLEDEPKCVVNRMISSLSRIQNRQLQQAFIANEEEDMKVRHAMQTLINKSLFFKEDTLSIIDLTAEIQSFVADEGIDEVVIDFLQLIPPGARFGNKQEQVDFVFGELVKMARQLKNTATLVVSQLRRTGDDVPTKEALYHSGALEQWSHTIGLIYRPSIPNFHDCCALILDKQKNGPTGSVALGWDPETVSYKDLKAERAQEYLEAISKI